MLLDEQGNDRTRLQFSPQWRRSQRSNYPAIFSDEERGVQFVWLKGKERNEPGRTTYRAGWLVADGSSHEL
jgi:hypothetical protein